MPALAKCTPTELKELLIEAGWRTYNETSYNWSLVKGVGSESIEIPRRGKLVSFELLFHALEAAELAPGDYFSLLDIVRGKKDPSES